MKLILVVSKQRTESTRQEAAQTPSTLLLFCLQFPIWHKCHPERGVAELKDLLFLRRATTSSSFRIHETHGYSEENHSEKDRTHEKVCRERSQRRSHSSGRKAFAEKEGAHLRPGVQGEADTPEKMKRKGSFLRRHFANPRGPMERDGEPTRLALSAQAWGEPVPKTEADAKQLADKGSKLLEQFHAATDGKEPARTARTARKKAPAKQTGAATKKVAKALKKATPAGKPSAKAGENVKAN